MRPAVIPDDYRLRPLNGFSHERYEAQDFKGILVSRDEIASKITQLAVALEQDYRSMRDPHNLHFLWVAEGARRFFEEFKKEYLYCATTESWTKVASYENDRSTGKREFENSDFSSLRGRDVLIFEDIVDTGGTIRDLSQLLRDAGVKSFRTVALIDKRLPGKTFTPDYALFSIPDAFIIGYNMDYNQEFRDLDDIYVISDRAREKYASGADQNLI